MAKQVFRLDFCGRGLTVETGEVAKQAGGAVLVRYDDTVVLSTATASKQAKEGIDFFPLTVLFEEKLYSVGKIPGGFLRPFNGPIAGVMVGRVDGEYIINPTPEQLEKSDINLTVAGTKYAVNMVESGAKEVSEEAMLGAIMFGHEHIKQLVAFQEEIAAAVGKEKMEVKLYTVDEDIDREVRAQFEQAIRDAVSIEKKLERYGKIDELTEEAVAVFDAKEYENEAAKAKVLKQVKQICHSIEADEVRRLIIEDKVRPDGRKVDEIRPLDSQVDILPRAHGSALFTRGETQVLSVTTLGPMNDNQIIDDLTEVETKRFMHHYNFPPYSVGETGRMGSPGRREIGHGALGERALSQVLPSVEDFPYTIRTVAEVTESNGSSSQASICAGTMSLMAAGVPIKAPVAGIAMGLIMDEENGKYTVLTDIQGMEDHFGDMDFKVAGTSKGITALQMDIKVTGITREVFEEALAQAKVARAQILENMMAAISEPREDVGTYAPKIEQFYIDPEKIREVIGPNGKMINKIIEASDDVKIDIEDDGHVVIYHMDRAAINHAADMIRDIVREAKVGDIYEGKVVRIEKFGAFVNLFPGTDGLLHISKINHERVNKVEDVLNIGDTVRVKVTEIDDRGRVNVSAKALLPRPRTEKKEEDAKPAAAAEDNKEA